MNKEYGGTLETCGVLHSHIIPCKYAHPKEKDSSVICKTCAIAGDMVAVARDWNDLEVLTIIDNVPTKEAVRSVAHLFHGLCKGSGHCDCQHKVDFEGKALQKK